MLYHGDDYTSPDPQHAQHQTHLQQMGDLRQELSIHGQATVQTIAGLRHQSHGKLVLEHDHGGPEGRLMRQKLEGKR